ncbi:hypothetical protein B5P41_32540, partial [Bacillus sp. SRB_28]
MITGKVKNNNGSSSTERDIVHYQSPSVSGASEEMPWIEAENQRVRLNKSQELTELGSIFIRYDGSGTKQKMQDIIKNRMYEDEVEKIYIWDPYVNDEVVQTLLEYAVSYPGLDI